MGNELVEVLAETLQILNQGSYTVNGKKVKLQLSKEQMEASHVLLPEEKLETGNNPTISSSAEQCRYDCVKQDSFVAAIQLAHDRPEEANAVKPVLVLNFANPVNIGGGVYKGASTQEEDLCRRSTLLRSLENSKAFHYYRYNRGLHTHMGSDAILLSPEVEIIRDEYGALMDHTTIVSVLTCAAPMITYGLEGMSEAEYRTMFYDRIVRVLQCAAYYGYQDLILGAWGCGAFGNDAAVVADLFSKALTEFRWSDMSANELFRHVNFAVRSKGGESYNFRQFDQRFGNDRFASK